MPYTPPNGNAASLDFTGAYTPPSGSAVLLTLGDITSNVTGEISATLASLIPDIYGTSAPNYTAAMEATLNGLSSGMAGYYDVHVWRGKSNLTRCGWDGVTAKPRGLSGQWKVGNKNPSQPRAIWKPSHANARGMGGGWGPIPTVRVHKDVPWERLNPAPRELSAGFNDPTAKPLATRHPWGTPPAKAPGLMLSYRHPPRKRLEPRFPWDTLAVKRAQWTLANRLPRQLRDQRRLPWNEGSPPPWIIRIEFPPVTPPAPRPPGQPGGLVLLDFRCPLPGGADLDFNTEPCPRKTIVINTAAMIRLPDSMPIPLTGLSLTHDLDSWAIGLQAQVPDRATLDLIAPGPSGPVEVQIGINNYQFSAIIESWDESRAFGNTGYTVTGRSRSALLAAPYSTLKSRLESGARTANQLADDELLNTGWTLVWDAPDWLVPAGIYSYQGKTLMDSIITVAQAAGLVVQPDPVEKIIRVLPRYPVSPWGWDAATPDAVIHDYHIQSASVRWSPKPAYNGVYVSGQNAGVTVYGKRAGTAGDNVAPMVVDPLITEVAAGQERARNILSDTGKISLVSLTMPVYYTAPGLILPGKLVEVRDTTETWRGMVTGLSVDVQNSDGELTATQTLEIERHH